MTGDCGRVEPWQEKSLSSMADHLFEIVARHAKESGAKIAISKWVSGRGFLETSYGELLRKAERFARVCKEATSEPSIVPMLVGRSADSVAFMLGTVATGRPFCFLSPKYRAPQVAAVLEATGSRICVVDATGVMALRGAWKDHPRLAEAEWLVIGERPQTKIYAQAEDDLRRAASAVLVDETSSADPAPVDRSGAARADVAGACLFTSGSTGVAKGVLISQADLMRRMDAEVDWFGLGKADVLLGILPFSFDVGLNQLMTVLRVGAQLVLLDSWLPADITTVAAERRVTGVSGVPSIWQDLINSATRFDASGPHASLRYLTVSGGSLSRDYLRKLSDVARGVAIFKTYGQTEAFRSTSLRPEDYDAKPDSVGKPFAGVRVYVVREDLTRCATGEVGEVIHSGLGIMLGYLGSAAEGESRKLGKNPFYGDEDDSPVAVFTGDMGYLDEHGYLYLKGRADSMLKVMGNRVYPNEVAHQILAIDAVREAVVVGMADENGQAKLTAFIAAPREAQLSAGAVKRALNASLPTFMIPKEIVFVEHIPRTPSGKPDQQRLIEEYDSKAARTAATGSEAQVGVER